MALHLSEDFVDQADTVVPDLESEVPNLRSTIRWRPRRDHTVACHNQSSYNLQPILEGWIHELLPANSVPKECQ
jgi:hypothetical protein